MLADEQGCRNGHRGIATVEGELHQGSLGRRQLHHRLEGRHHRIGDVVGEPPEGEVRSYQDKDEEVFPLHQLFTGHRLLVERSEIGASTEIRSLLVHSESVPCRRTEDLGLVDIVHADRDPEH